jgi:protease-4
LSSAAARAAAHGTVQGGARASPDGELPELATDGGGAVRRSRRRQPAVAGRGAAPRQDGSRITSVVVIPGSLDSPYWGRLQELREAVLDFRRSGKPVTAFLEFGGDREYYLASAADKVYLLPTSSLDLTGIANYEIFLRGVFDKVGAYPDFVHIGEYKTATNQLTETGMTPEHREMATALTRDTFEQLLAGIADGRKKTEADVRALVDRGPFLPQGAMQAGLVDGVAYQDQLDDLEPVLRQGGRAVDWVEVKDYDTGGGGVRLRRRPRIAVLYAVGTIVSGRSGFDATDGDIVGSESIVEDIRRIRDDRSIRGIVLRIDSPGGSSVASDVILRELMLTKERAPERPIVVSMSDLAASGGYYIALAGDEIVAQPGTLTGSIGIYTGKIVYGGTLASWG